MGVSVFPAPASGPTLAEIQAAVSTYSKGPLDMTWTNVGYVNPNGTTTQTITGLGGYKYLKIMSSNVYNGASAGNSFNVRFNSDATANAYVSLSQRQHGTGTVTTSNNISNAFNFYPNGSTTAQSSFIIEMLNPTSTTSKKLGVYKSQGWDGSAHYNYQGDLIWSNTAAITSVTIFASASFFVTDGLITDGFHVYGAN